MKVKELIEQLSKLDQELDVVCYSDSTDGDDYTVITDIEKISARIDKHKELHNPIKKPYLQNEEEIEVLILF